MRGRELIWLLSAMCCVLLLIPGAGCSSGSPVQGDSVHVEGEFVLVERDLGENMKRWQAKNIKNYSYTFGWNCFCMPDHVALKRIRVRNGAIDAISFLEDGRPLDVDRYGDYHIIDSLFAIIEDGIERDADEITVLYDSACGYPASVFIDYDRKLADEERGFHVKDFTEE